MHIDKTLLGLLLSTSLNRAQSDQRLSALLGSHQHLTTIQRKGLRMLLALKAPLCTYCPAVLTIGTLVRECNWAGGGASFVPFAKQALEMSLMVILIILKSDEHVNT